MKTEYDYVIVKVPQGTLFADMPEATQDVIKQSLDARWPPTIAPGTQPVGGYQLIIALIPRARFLQMAADNGIDTASVQASPAAMKATLEGMAATFGLTWELMYMRTVEARDTGQVDADGNPIMAPYEFYQMDVTVKDYLNPVDDGNGNMVAPTLPAMFTAYDMPEFRQYPVMVQ